MKYQYDVDPDGRKEDTKSVINKKLVSDCNIRIEDPESVTGSTDVTVIPPYGIVDMFNYFANIEDDSYSLGTFREYFKMEGYTMALDGHVR